MRTAFGLAAAALTVSQAAHAQAITEAEFLSGLNPESAAVRSLGEALARAEAARRRAGLLQNPRVDFWRESPDGAARVTNWTLAWAPPLDGRYGPARKA